MAVASLFLFVALVPYPIVGEYWGIFWYLIAWPFSGLLKPLWAFSDIISRTGHYRAGTDR